MKIIQGNQIIYYEQAATPEFWDHRWQDLQEDPGRHTQFQLPDIIFNALNASVPKGGRILEAGCGMGTIVYALNTCGWRCTGVDFAQQTIEAIRRVEPELDVLTADVRRLPFPDETFEGYVSIGVIEHFFEGYSEIFQEMHRVLRRHGTALISFPAMNPLRRMKKDLGLYPTTYEAGKDEEPLEFYQYALDHRNVVRDLQNLGYSITTIQWYEAWLGLADESPVALGRVFRRIYNNRHSKVYSAVRRTFESFAGLMGYCCQVVARKDS
ncbi:MAG TPA: class I SAM-dependent methyltransferase [Thermodesulfovibrionales bacterium]|nr:class I SAM-dependent methyltransferase [Thermodesulfovibrionales bacterium]